MVAHIAAGQRLQQRAIGPRPLNTSSDDGEAILRPDGKIEHAEGHAKSSTARASLRDAATVSEAGRKALTKLGLSSRADLAKLYVASAAMADHGAERQ